MIPSITLKELYREVFRRSTLIAIPHLSELLEVPDSEFSKWEVFTQIVKDSLYKFEYYYPLARIQKVFIEVDLDSRKAKYYPNFEAYLNGALDEDDITLPIISCQGLAFNGYVNSQYPLRNFRFENGEFTDFWYTTRTYWANCLCKRPLIEKYLRENQEYADECKLYWMAPEVGSIYSIFRDQVFVEVCRYIINIRKNMMLNNMPIELFQGLEDDFNRVDQNLQNTYQQAHKSGFYLV